MLRRGFAAGELVLSSEHQEFAALGPPQRQSRADDIHPWVETWNENPQSFIWHKSADEILHRLAGYCTAINQK